MCEYDLEHYSEHPSGSGAFLVPESGSPYNNEREMLFNELGLYNQGFGEGIIHPEKGIIEFYQSGVYVVRLVYSREEGLKDGELYDTIGEHFSIIYYKVGQPMG